MTELFELRAREIAACVAAGEASPVEVVDSFLNRISAVETRVQAWSLLDADGARDQARILESEVAKGRLRGPLHGVPVGVKDEFHVKGMPTGMRGWSDPPLEPEDATCVARLRDAGAIILGKTHMPVFGKLPPTRNPWNLEYTAGGTSSGSGAAVAARMVPIALGEQTVGSNLRPAAYCGVDAIKPSYGRVSRFGCYPFVWSHDHVGIIAQGVDDLALVLSVIAGPDPRDPTALLLPPPEADLSMEDMRPPQVGVVRNFLVDQTEPEMQAAVDTAVARFAEAGASVEDVLLPEVFRLASILRPLLEVEEFLFHTLAQVQSAGAPAAPKPVSSLVPATYYVQARRVRNWLIDKISTFIADFDCVLMPVASGAAPKGLESTGNASFLIPWSFLGLPAVTINGGLSQGGLPLGLQLVASRLEDNKLLRASAWCEDVLGRLPPPPLS